MPSPNCPVRRSWNVRFLFSLPASQNQPAKRVKALPVGPRQAVEVKVGETQAVVEDAVVLGVAEQDVVGVT